MRALRTLLSWLFAVSGCSCFGIAVRFVREALQPSEYWTPTATLLELLIAALFVIQGLIFSLAWWTTFREKPSSRGWGIAASASLILAAVFPVILCAWFDHDLSLLWEGFAMTATVLGIGVAGLVAFLLPVSRKGQQQKLNEAVPIPGDGTNGLVNKGAGLLAFVLSYAAYSWWLHWLQNNDVAAGLNFLSKNLIFFGVLAVLIVVHELGHAAAGLALGMKLCLFALGPLQWSRSKCKWKFGFAPRMTARRDGAVVVLPSTARPPRWHGTFVAIAGPAANLVSGALALLIALTASTNSILESYGLLALFGSMSMAVAIINLIPFRLGQYYSDGARCLQDMSNSPLSDFRRVIRSVMAVGESPLRPRDYDLEAIDGALKGFGAGMEGHYLKLYAFDSYFDQGKIAEAAKVLAEAEAIYDSLGLKAETEISFVLGYAGLLEDPVAARRWWERLEARNPDRSQAGYWLAKCALEYAEGHREDAIAALHHADTLVAELPPTGSQAYDIEWSARLHGQVEKISEAACAATA